MANPGWLWDFFDELYKDSSARAPPPPAPEVANSDGLGSGPPQGWEKTSALGTEIHQHPPLVGGGGRRERTPSLNALSSPTFTLGSEKPSF